MRSNQYVRSFRLQYYSNVQTLITPFTPAAATRLLSGENTALRICHVCITEASKPPLNRRSSLPDSASQIRILQSECVEIIFLPSGEKNTERTYPVEPHLNICNSSPDSASQVRMMSPQPADTTFFPSGEISALVIQ